MASNFGSAYQSNKQYKEAEEHFEITLEAIRGTHLEDHKVKVSCMVMYSMISLVINQIVKQ
jgi:hypothetical protein